MAALNIEIFRAVNEWPDWVYPLLVPLSTVNDRLFFKVAILALVIAMVWRGGRARRAALLALVAFPIADGICNLAKHMVPVARPFQELADVHLRVGSTASMGTASSHAANLAAVATVMTLGLGFRWGAAWIAAALVVGVARVYAGAHYPNQVLLGWAIGISVGFMADRLTRIIVQRRRSLSEGAGP